MREDEMRDSSGAGAPAIDPKQSASDAADIACERCLGTGWIRIRHAVRDEHGIYHDRSQYPDCRRCNGTGIEPPDAPEVDRG